MPSKWRIHAIFFGRDALIQTLIERMTNQETYERFLAIVGPSGSGKSSVVKAGLIPALWKGGNSGVKKMVCRGYDSRYASTG